MILAWIRRLAVRHPKLVAKPFSLPISALAGVASMLLLLFPNIEKSVALAEALPTEAEVVWLVMFGLGAFTYLYSVAKGRPDLEVAGSLVLAWVALIDAIAILTVRGLGGFLVQVFVLGAAFGFLFNALVVMALNPERRPGRKPGPRRRA